ncbi:MAG: GGDEF domain-containing protein [Bacillota bacterium]
MVFGSDDRELIKRIVRLASIMLAASGAAGVLSAYVPYRQPGVNFAGMWGILLATIALWAVLVFMPWIRFRPVYLIPSTVLGLGLVALGQYLVAGDRGTFISLVYLVLVLGAAFYTPRETLFLSIFTALLTGLPIAYDYNVDFVRRWIVQLPVMVGVGYFSSVAINELKRSSRERRELAAISKAARVSTTLDLAATLQATADQLGQVLKADASLVYMLEEDVLTVRTSTFNPAVFPEAVAERVRSHPVRVGNGLTGWVAEHGEPIITGDAERDPRAGHVPGTSYDDLSYVVVPLKVEDRVIGVISNIRQGKDRYHKDILGLVSIFADQAAVAIENARLYEETRELAATDSLTGLKNWRSISDHLERELRRAVAERGEVSLVMMDCDQFKAVNDRLGHLSGDRLLRELGRCIEGVLTEGRILGRYAGDEFIILLPDTGATEASRLAELVRSTVSETEFSLQGGVVRMTISLGVATYPRAGRDAEALLKAADDAMYRSKTTGGNFVSSAAGE